MSGRSIERIQVDASFVSAVEIRGDKQKVKVSLPYIAWPLIIFGMSIVRYNPPEATMSLSAADDDGAGAINT
jgi:hypothetical protein